MKRRRRATGAGASQPTTERIAVRAGAVRPRGWKLWGFRTVAVIGVPVVFFVLLELALRVAGIGHPVSFLLATTRQGQPVFEPNNRFGWRFFGPELARLPYPFSIAQEKPRDRIRIFVFGESAAKGDPDPHFGLARVLEATLSWRHPGVRFEVINAAMTAINSHVVLPIARDCARAGGDVWVIYMGNNEVVGPFGAGTVFGPQTPPLPFIRGALTLQSARTGQLLDSMLRSLRKSPAESGEWGGMEMFLDQQVLADDPRMSGVYHHFEQNLADIIRAGRRSGAGVVVSTVAVNLRDCAPFASLHRTDLSTAEQVRWDESFQRGVLAQAAGKHAEAAEFFQEAARLDDSYAELRFRQGDCALALDRKPEAREQFRAACDLDTLRFRCDTRLNDLTRKVAAGRESDRVRLADAERRFIELSPEGSPGSEFFYEHVHLTFEGNYRLARLIAEEIETLLALPPAAATWPASTDCAQRLGWADWSRLAGWKGVLPRLNRPPFTAQFDHPLRMKQVDGVLAELSPADQPAGISNALRLCETALTASPDDAALAAQVAMLANAAGDLTAAAKASRRALELLPCDAEEWLQFGLIQVRQRQFDAAADAFRRATQLDSRNVAAREHLAQCLAALGRKEDAVAEFRRVLAQHPRLGLAWLHLGQTLEQLGRKAEAGDCYQRALGTRSQNTQSLIELAGFCQGRGWFEAAATNYVAAIKSDPTNAKLHVGAGQNFAALGRTAEAAHYSAEAVRLAPEFAEARLLHGMTLGRQGDLTRATTEFREALQLKPDLLDARLNLGIALMDRDPAAALACFEEILRQYPTHPAALKYLQLARAKLGAQPQQ